MADVKKKQPVNGMFYTTSCGGKDTSCFVYVENKQKTEGAIYGFEDTKISSAIIGRKDNQVYKRKTEAPGYSQEFSDGISTYVDFYKNGAIHTIRHLGNNLKVAEIPVGIWYAYSEKGDLIQKIEHDDHFKMNFYDILKIADRYTFPDIRIYRKFNDVNSYWYIYLKPHYRDGVTKSRSILIDDKTGEIIYDISQDQEKYVKTKNYDSLQLSKESLNWLKNNDLHQIPDGEFYKLFRGY